MPYTSLQQALDASQLAAQQTYKLGNESLARCEAAITSTRAELGAYITELKRMDADASEAVDALENQLLQVGAQLETNFKAQVANFETFHKRLEHFSLTLFGRTMAGKSTLMEILTEGDGASIGKGAQRTTRDVRTYQWKNLDITDVPGIAAFDGQGDEDIAYAAARHADIILFLITDDAPQPIEAEHLARIIALGKPVIGLLNLKMATERPQDLKRFESRHQKLFDKKRIRNIVEQFHQLLHQFIDEIQIDFYPIHLRARFLADNPDYLSQRDKLCALSGFEAFEARLLQEVVERGPMIRTRTLGDAAVLPLLEMIRRLFDFAQQNQRIAQLFNDKRDQVQNWRPEHRQASHAQLAEAIRAGIDDLRNQVPGFVEEFLEDKKIDKEWKARIERVDLKGIMKSAQKDVAARSKDDLLAFGKELEQEIIILATEFDSLNLSATRIIDTRRIASWAIIGVSLGVALLSVFAVAAAPMVAGTGFALAVGGSEILFKLFTKSREQKLKKHRAELTEQLSKNLDAIEEEARSTLDIWYTENIDAAFVVPFTEHLHAISTTLDRLAQAQRQLAIRLLEEVKIVNQHILRRALQELDEAPQNTPALEIARVPGVESALIIPEDDPAILGIQLELERMLDSPLRLVMSSDDPRAVIKQLIGPTCEYVATIDTDAGCVAIRCLERSVKTDTRINLAQQLTGLQIIALDALPAKKPNPT